MCARTLGNSSSHLKADPSKHNVPTPFAQSRLQPKDFTIPSLTLLQRRKVMSCAACTTSLGAFSAEHPPLGWQNRSHSFSLQPADLSGRFTTLARMYEDVRGPKTWLRLSAAFCTRAATIAASHGSTILCGSGCRLHGSHLTGEEMRALGRKLFDEITDVNELADVVGMMRQAAAGGCQNASEQRWPRRPGELLVSRWRPLKQLGHQHELLSWQSAVMFYHLRR